ncbi:copper homeostasis protein CutC [Gemella sp. Musashino-2025]
MFIVEVCANSVRDCLISQTEGAGRIELVGATNIGGLTPTTTTLDMVLERGVTIPIICMVRPRGGGFCYTELEKEQMFREARELLKHGASGIAFGFLTEDRRIDWQATEKMIELCDSFGAESVFHRAYDVAKNPEHNIQRLVGLGCTRILTSGLGETVEQGASMLRYLQEKYGRHIEILAGAGVNSNNIKSIVEQTGVTQIHGTFKTWGIDPTTTGEKVSYIYSNEGHYEETSPEVLNRVVELLQEQ